MDKTQFSILVTKYLDGTATPQERGLVEEYYQRLTSRSDLSLPPEKEQVLERAMLETILGQINQPASVRRIRPMRFRWAAAAVLLILTTAAAYWLFFKEQASQKTATNKELILPGSNQAVLTLADGSRIILGEKLSRVIPQQSGTRILQSSPGQLIYSLVNRSARPAQGGPVAETWNTLSTPAGGQYALQLPDGTAVRLDAASSIRYPVAFNGKERKVEVTGQVYFKVTHNKALPFRVVVNGQIIEDLGTEFNINAYDDEPALSTTLLEGSIRLHHAGRSLLMRPGQQALTRPGSKEIVVQAADTEEVTAWKNGYFRFNDENIESIMRKVSRWYNVEVVYKNDVSDQAFSGRISRSKNISQVLKVLAATQAVHFSIEGRRIMVSR